MLYFNPCKLVISKKSESDININSSPVSSKLIANNGFLSTLVFLCIFFKSSSLTINCLLLVVLASISNSGVLTSFSENLAPEFDVVLPPKVAYVTLLQCGVLLFFSKRPGFALLVLVVCPFGCITPIVVHAQILLHV